MESGYFVAHALQTRYLQSIDGLLHLGQRERGDRYHDRPK